MYFITFSDCLHYCNKFGIKLYSFHYKSKVSNLKKQIVNSINFSLITSKVISLSTHIKEKYKFIKSSSRAKKYNEPTSRLRLLGPLQRLEIILKKQQSLPQLQVPEQPTIQQLKEDWKHHHNLWFEGQ